MGVEEIKKIAKPILKKHGVKKAAVFGSAARGEAGPESDIDLLVEMKKGTVLDFVELKFALEDSLGKEVDLLEYSAIKPALKSHILKDQVFVL